MWQTKDNGWAVGERHIHSFDFNGLGSNVGDCNNDVSARRNIGVAAGNEPNLNKHGE